MKRDLDRYDRLLTIPASSGTRVASRPHQGVEWWTPPARKLTALPILRGRPTTPGRHRRSISADASPDARPAATW